MTHTAKISVVVPCFNAADKIGRCIASLRNITLEQTKFEVIFIDDCSTDGTFELIENSAYSTSNWFVYRLEKNSGSPSQPRNYGIKKSTGKYIYFIDCDDEIFPNALLNLYNLAESTGADLVRAELIVDDGNSRTSMNKLPQWNSQLTLRERRTAIVSGQSTTVDSFIRKDILTSNKIAWPEHLRMGEDTIFLSRVLASSKKIEYLDSPTYIYYKRPSLTPASTQRYGRRELRDHLEVWETVQGILLEAGVNYQEARLQVGLRVAIESMIFRNRGDIDLDSFTLLSKFISANWQLIQNFNYSSRIRPILSAIRERDFNEFKSIARPRLLIAGFDLKFISDALPELGEYFDIRVDQWQGHTTHDEAASRRHLEWAEYVWCEWLLGNAEWYSENVKPSQKLIIRMHRMELGRTHGEHLKVEAVHAVIAVSTFFFERLLERFPNIPRTKARLLHNYIRPDSYNSEWHDDRAFTLGMIGILPSRKGFYRSLEILKKLREKNKRFKLKVFGQRPEDLPWISKDPSEMSYFNACTKYISDHNLSDSVHFMGHSNISIALEKERVGYILSTSDADQSFPGPESFHLAIGDGFAAGGVSLVLSWPGAEYLWDQSAIFTDINLIAERVIELSSAPETFKAASQAGLKFIQDNYSITEFSTSVKELFLEF